MNIPRSRQIKLRGKMDSPLNFISFFIDLLGVDLVASFNAAYNADELAISQRIGVITLIPKKDGSLLELSNWRPITLLNVDCKLAAEVIAKRIEPHCFQIWCTLIKQASLRVDI